MRPCILGTYLVLWRKESKTGIRVDQDGLNLGYSGRWATGALTAEGRGPLQVVISKDEGKRGVDGGKWEGKDTKIRMAMHL